MNPNKNNIFALTLINLIMDKYINKALDPITAMQEINRALKNYAAITKKDCL